MIQTPFDVGSLIPGLFKRGRRRVRMVTCVVRPEKVDEVVEALHKLDMVGGVTVTDVRGFGRQKGTRAHFMGGDYVIRFVPKVRMDMAVPAEDVPEVLEALHRSARTGEVGDGKAFVVDVVDALRIRTNERGASAL